MDNLIIREMAEEDCENLSALTILVYLGTYALDGIRDNISKFVLENFSPDNFRAILESSAVRCFLVELKQHVVGVVIVNLESKCEESEVSGYEIETIYIHPNFQRVGIGRRILEFLGDNVGEKLWLKTWEHNHKAIEFYKKNGFEIVGETVFKLYDESHRNHVFSK